MTCRHMTEKVPTGACYECAQWMFRFSPAEVEAMSQALVKRQHPELVPVEARPRLCSRDGCEGKHAAKGLCQHHYDLYRRPSRRSLLLVVAS